MNEVLKERSSIRKVWTAIRTSAIVAAAITGATIISACSTQRSLSYDQMRQEYDPELDGYNYADDYDDYYYDYMGY